MRERAAVLDYLEERFGIGRRHFDAFGLYMGSKGRLFLGPKRVPGQVRPVSVGILAARIGKAVKPTTNLLQLFGRYATRNVVQLSKEQAIAYLNGDDLKVSEKETRKATEGYVLLKYLGFSLGCGMLKEGTVRNLLPKAKRMEAKFI